MPRPTPVRRLPRFRKHLLALAAGAALAPNGVWAVDLLQAPPGTVQPYVTPNVIISVDDSGSMDYCLTLQKDNKEGTSNCQIAWDANGNPTQYASVSNTLVPDANGNWPGNARRINVLKYSLKQVFNDTALLPDKKIRIAWQAMWNNGGSPGIGPEKINGSTTSKAGANSVYNGTDTPTAGTNSMKVLDNTHRTNFISFIDKLDADNGTPSHWMFSQADAYMRSNVNSNGPWSGNPGGSDTASTTYLGCRRNYHIMMTDGRWNTLTRDIGDTTRRDNATNIALPNGTIYGGTTAAEQSKTALYRDGHSKTLADWAFYSWATPLRTSGLTGNPQPTADYDKATQTENFGKDSAGNDAILERFWNPRYNPATWPHMVTYAIGFSNMAVTWPGAPTIQAPTSKVPFGYDGSFPDLVTGTKKWPDMGTGESVRSLDLWHAALNGRGRFYAVEKGEHLEKAFREIFGQINTQTDPDMTSTATSGSNTSRNDVGKYTGNYEPKNAWKGYVTAETVKKDGTTEATAGWGGQNTAQKIDAMNPGDRRIFTWNDKWATSKYTGGTPFKWTTTENNLSTSQKLWLQKNLDGTDEGATAGQNRLDYIRGDRSKEGSDSSGYPTSKPYRQRQSAQGDIINSVVWYVGAPASNYALKGYSTFTSANKTRTPMIYVGGNDGMLHGFSAADGSEKMAYVPQGVIPSLTRLTNPTYNQKHRFFVDGSPMTGDVDMGAGVQDPDAPNYDPTYSPTWRTLLVGTLGAGGKGYFVLDVTDPNAFLEANASTLVKLDRTRSTEAGTTPNCALTTMSSAEKTACNKATTEDKDIGNITARPVLDDTNPMRTTQITRMNNNRWAVVMGNGYNSANQRPVLLVQYLDNDPGGDATKNMKLLRLPATTEFPGQGKAADNGLAAPRLVDINGDGRPDIAYAGDNLGNMWKFDLTSVDDTQWGVAPFGASITPTIAPDTAPSTTSGGGVAGTPLFTAKGPGSLGSARTIIQPITVAPTARPNDRKKTVGTGPTAKTVDVGGMMVVFGTGRNVTKADESDRNVQTLYSVLDNTRYKTVSTTLGSRLQVHPGGGTCTPVPAADCAPVPAALGEGVATAKLVQRTITDLSGGDFGQVEDATTLDWAVNNGWYMDFPAVGERLLKPIDLYDGSNILAVYSQVPAKGSDVDPNVESCESSTVDEERQYRTFINMMDGKSPSVQLVDVNGDGAFDAADGGGSGKRPSRRKVTKGSHNLINSGNKVEDIDVKNNREKLARMPEQSLRSIWRQLK